MEPEPGFENGAPSITPDGKTLIFTQTPIRDKTGDNMTPGLGKAEAAKPFIKTPDPELGPPM